MVCSVRTLSLFLTYYGYVPDAIYALSAVPSEGNGVALDDSHTPSLRQFQEMPVPYEPWYSRLFHRRAQCSPGTLLL